MPLDDDAQDKWKRVRARLKAGLGEEAFSSWLASLQLEEIKETIFYCSVPTSFLKHWIEKHYAKSVVAGITEEWPEATKVYILQRFAGQPVIIPDPKKAPEEDVLIGGPKEASMEARTSNDASSNVDSVLDATNSQSSSAEEKDDQGATEDHGEVILSPPPQLLDPNRRIYVIDIIRYACTWYKLARKLMLSEKRTHDIVKPRQIGMFLSKHMTNRSLPEIGRTFGGRDHTTVLHSVRKIEEEVRDNIEFAYEVASLEAAIRQMQLA